MITTQGQNLYHYLFCAIWSEEHSKVTNLGKKEMDLRKQQLLQTAAVNLLSVTHRIWSLLCKVASPIKSQAQGLGPYL